MMGKSGKVAGVLWLAGWACACASNPSSNSIAGSTPPPTTVGTTTVMQPVATPPAAPTTTAPGVQMPPAPTAPPSTAQPTGDKNRPEAGPGSRANDPDYCQERRVSYSKPCHNDPDPCRINSGWPGDEFCWPAPAPNEGIQIHIGPRDYKDPAEIAKYVMEPGSEFNNSVVGHIPLTEKRFYNRVMVRMRPGSHHWLSQIIGGQPEERFYDGEYGCVSASDPNQSQSYGTIGGGQTLIYDNPPGGMVAPENAGIGNSLPGNSSLCMNLHAYNYSDHKQLREMWINVYFVDEAKVTQPTEPIVIIAGLELSVPPGEKKELSYIEEFAAPGRIIQLWGHRHVWTNRFAVWLNDGLIYDSWDWRESVVFNYDSITTNAALNPDAKLDGATSGVLKVNKGDKLKFSCFIENTSDMTLAWRNELYGGEMCNLWGTTVGDGSGLQGSYR
jgi:hypothetical protein